MTIHGRSLIDGELVSGTAGELRGVDPATGDGLEPTFGLIGPVELDRAVRAAADAAPAYAETTPEHRARLLEAIADRLDALGEEIITRASRETGLPTTRTTSELGRTTGQLRLFAAEVRLGEHQEVRVQHADPDQTPPSPDLRLRMIPLGPVAVFGASNFPLAFSTAGGDTASALAAGCPVVVKGHNAHPGTAELAGQAVAAALTDVGLPAGVFGLVFGPGTEIGRRLVTHPAITAVGFTGSRSGGLALVGAAAERDVPIPVYAEMSSINPVVVLPGALDRDADAVADGFVASLTLGAGQFCTNPGLVLLPAGRPDVVERIASAVRAATGQTMLTADIATAYAAARDRLAGAGAELVAEGDGGSDTGPAVYRTTAALLRTTADLQAEVFGATAVVVEYDDLDDLLATLTSLEGQLTVTVRADPEQTGDLHDVRRLLPVLERLAGRVILNGWPTGVEVSHAMVHGGPFPATSDGRTTSVGTLAIRRFQRPVCYQGFPDELLPPATREDNPWALPRRVDGVLET